MRVNKILKNNKLIICNATKEKSEGIRLGKIRDTKCGEII